MTAEPRDLPAAGRKDHTGPIPLEEIVRRAVKEHVNGADAVLLAGSSAHGVVPDNGDLDVVVFTNDHRERSRRLLVRRQGFLIEMFVITERDYPAMLRKARKTALPSLLRMCRDSRIVDGGERARRYVEAAERAFAAGPLPVTYAELDRRRWELTELADDFRQTDRSEALFVAGKMLEKTAEFMLRAEDRWLGVGKWAFRTLEEHDPAAARELSAAADAFFRFGDRRPLVRFVERTLAPCGGPLREGWMEEAQLPARPSGTRRVKRTGRQATGKRTAKRKGGKRAGVR